MSNDLDASPAAADAEAELGSNVAGRLNLALRGRNLEEAAQYAGINRKTLARYLKGEVPKLRALINLARLCGVSFEWLATGDVEQVGPHQAVAEMSMHGHLPSQKAQTGQPSVYVPIPRYNIQASAGFGAMAEHEQVVEYLAYDLDFVRTRLRRDPKYLVLIEARGDSMEPTIRDGDILTVDIAPAQPLQHSQLYVVRVDDNLMVKRLELRLDGGLIVHSDNPRYAPETLARANLDTLHILGRVLLVTTPPR